MSDYDSKMHIVVLCTTSPGLHGAALTRGQSVRYNSATRNLFLSRHVTHPHLETDIHQD